MKTETLLRTIREQLEDADLLGSFLVRDLRTGEEIGIEPDVEFAAASLVKVPLAVVTLDRIRKGELDGSEELPVRPGVDVVRERSGSGSSGIRSVWRWKIWCTSVSSSVTTVPPTCCSLAHPRPMSQPHCRVLVFMGSVCVTPWVT